MPIDYAGSDSFYKFIFLNMTMKKIWCYAALSLLLVFSFVKIGKSIENNGSRIKELIEKAEAKQIDSMLFLATIYLHGLDEIAIKKNESKFLYYITICSELGNGTAFKVLGLLNFYGKIVDKNYENAYLYLLLSEKLGADSSSDLLLLINDHIDSSKIELLAFKADQIYKKIVANKPLTEKSFVKDDNYILTRDEGSGKSIVLSQNGEIYTATMKNGLPSGRGVYLAPDGRKYDGNYDKGKRSGWGLMTFPDNSKFIGTWENDTPNGYADLYLSDGSHYSGFYKNGLWHGVGAVTYADGTKYSGAYKDGKRCGDGSMTYPNGATFFGEWDNDLPNGYGTVIIKNENDPNLADGYTGKYVNSKLVIPFKMFSNEDRQLFIEKCIKNAEAEKNFGILMSDNSSSIDMKSIYSTVFDMFENDCLNGKFFSIKPFLLQKNEYIKSLKTKSAKNECNKNLNGLVLHLKGEENEQNLHSPYEIDLVNGVVHSDGYIGKSFSFDGKRTCIKIKDRSNLEFNQLDLIEHTIEMWIFPKKQEGENFHGLIVKQKANNSGRNFYVGLTNDAKIHYSFSSNSTTLYLESNNSVTDNTWHHVAVTYNGINMNIYIDGKLNATKNVGFMKPDFNEEPMLIGHTNENAQTFFNGLIDELIIYNKSHSETEINDKYHCMYNDEISN